MKHILKFNKFILNENVKVTKILESLDEIQIDDIRDNFNFRDATQMAEVEVADMYDWEDTDRWTECDNESEWISSYQFAEEEVTQNVIDQIINQYDIEDTEENRAVIESIIDEMK